MGGGPREEGPWVPGSVTGLLWPRSQALSPRGASHGVPLQGRLTLGWGIRWWLRRGRGHGGPRPVPHASGVDAGCPAASRLPAVTWRVGSRHCSLLPPSLTCAPAPRGRPSNLLQGMIAHVRYPKHKSHSPLEPDVTLGLSPRDPPCSAPGCLWSSSRARQLRGDGGAKRRQPVCGAAPTAPLSRAYVSGHQHSSLTLTHSFIHACTHSFTHSLTHIHSLIYSRMHSFIYACTHSFTFIHSFTQSFIHPLTHQLFIHIHSLILTHSLIHSSLTLTDSLIHLFIRSFTYPLIHSLVHSFIHSPAHSFTCSLTHHSFTFIHSYSLIHLFTYSPTHSFIHTAIHSHTHSFTHSPCPPHPCSV